MISSAHQVKLRGLTFEIQLNISPKESLSVELEALNSSAEVKRWSGSFSSQYIEQVTKKTGNFKRFTVFCEMVSAASSNDNHALASGQANVSLDLISAADLAPDSLADTALVECDKLYLVLTYAVAFDRPSKSVHYPLPLQKVEAQQRLPAIYISPQNNSTQPAFRSSEPSERTMNLESQLRTLEETVKEYQVEIHSLKLEKEHHLRELAHFMRENDKLRHAVKYPEPTNHEASRRNNTATSIPVAEMPDLFKTLFKGITGNPSHSDTFKKSAKALQRLVEKLLEVSNPNHVQTAMFELAREEKSRSKQRPLSQREGSRQKSAPKSTSQRTIAPNRYEPNNDSPPYKPLKSRPLGASYGSNDHLQYNSSSRKKPAAKDSPSWVSTPASRNSSVTSTRRRFDPTSYILEKELKLLAKREASQESLRARQRSASFPRETAFSNVGVIGSGRIRSSTGGYSSRDSSLEKSSMHFENAKSGASMKRGTKPKNSVKKRQADIISLDHAAAKTKVGWELDKEREEDIDKRLAFLQQYLTMLNQ
ncbi:Coiled-coil domain-containing protein 61 [Chytriomyces hyalinus]|nr:Coiled-coil domain-containing protein 61 [Chytriomyces hyalinus]